MAQHNHAQGVPQVLAGLDAGQDVNSNQFQQYYRINVVGWDINCAACCWTYLTQVRNYAIAYGQVRFGLPDIDFIRCFIAPAAGGNPHGQFKTEQDPHLGTPVLGLLVRSSSTFRFYADPAIPSPQQIGSDVTVTARIESISIHKVTDEKINGSWLCYNHAAVCERFRETAEPALPCTTTGSMCSRTTIRCGNV